MIYNYVGPQTIFWIVCWFGFTGFLVTQIFIPDTTGLDLREADRYWAFVREGRAGDYHGIAVHPRHLSAFEIYVLGRHKAYNPELDRQSRVKELKVMYEAKQQVKEQGKQEEMDDDEESELSSTAASYFESKQAALWGFQLLTGQL